jgi:uncharacterized protein YraI
MKRLLLSLWLSGAVIYAGSTLLFTDAVDLQGLNPFRSPPNSAPPTKIAQSKPLPSPPAQLEQKTVTPSEQVTAHGDKSTSPHAISPEQPSSEGATVETPTMPPESEASGVAAPTQAPGGPETVGESTQTETPGQPPTPPNPLPNQSETTGESTQTQAPGQPPQAPPNPLPSQSETLRVASAASIRKGPSTSHDIVGTVQAGAEVQVLTRESGWVQFMDSTSGRTGWIYSKFLVSDAVTPDTESAEGPPVAQLPTDEPPAAKAKQKSKGTAQSSARQVSKQPSPTDQRSRTPPPVTADGTASTGTPPRKQLAQEEPKNPEELQAKSTAQTSEEQVTQEALPPTELPSKGWRPDESSELSPDAEFLPPRKRRFGLFARRRMLRDGMPPTWEEEFPPPRY